MDAVPSFVTLLDDLKAQKRSWTIILVLVGMTFSRLAPAQTLPDVVIPADNMLTTNMKGKINVLNAIEKIYDRYSPPASTPKLYPACPILDNHEELSTYDQEGGTLSVAADLDEPDDIDPGGNSDYSPFSLPNNYYYEYILSRVSTLNQGNVSSRLARLSHTMLYGFYVVMPRTEMMKLPPISLETEFFLEANKLNRQDLPNLKPVPAIRARFAREIDLAGGKFQGQPTVDVNDNTRATYVFPNGALRIPIGWNKLFREEAPQKLWVECAVKVNREGFPIDAPLRHLRPIALQTNKGLYEAIQVAKAVTVKHGYEVLFNNPTFRLVGSQITADSVRKLIDLYHDNLKKAFSDDPLSAEEDLSAPPVPGEFYFTRAFKKSNVLAGFAGPYKERSYYVLKWWRLDDGGLYTIIPVHKGGYGAPGSNIVLHVAQSLTIDVGASDVYSEPTPEQVAKYKSAVTETMAKAAKMTASVLAAEESSPNLYSIDILKLNGGEKQ